MPMRFMHWYRKEHMHVVPCYEQLLVINQGSPELRKQVKYSKAKNKLLREELKRVELDNIYLANRIRLTKQKHLKVPV